ncbi:MAG: hypothetical protein R2861_10540 [Desulfobacterales bacterium]
MPSHYRLHASHQQIHQQYALGAGFCGKQFLAWLTPKMLAASVRLCLRGSDSRFYPALRRRR